MLPFHHILLPVDFSEQSLGMVNYATHLATEYRSRLSLLHVIEDPLVYPMVPDAGVPELPLQRVEEIENYLREFAKEELAGPCVKRRVRRGNPAETILDYIRQEKVDLVAMPTHGYGVFRRFLLGSVTAKILHDADIPVLTGAHFADSQAGAEANPLQLRRVLCAVDFGPHSEKTLRFAAQLAEDMKAELGVAHVLELPDPRLAAGFTGEWELDLVRNAKEQLHSLQREVSAPGDVFVKIGDPGQQIAHLAAHTHADLLVIGRSAEHGLGGRLRSSAYSVIRQAPCPVMSV